MNKMRPEHGEITRIKCDVRKQMALGMKGDMSIEGCGDVKYDSKTLD